MSADVSSNVMATVTIPSVLPVAIGRLIAPPDPGSPGQSIGTNAFGNPVSGPYSPAQIRHAYGIDQLSYDGTGQTIAIIDAHDSPTIAADLIAFDQHFGLPVADFTKVTPPGQQTPTFDSGWALEISLDVEWAHAIAPGAKILLVETDAATVSSLMGGVSYAIAQGANQVSMSWGGSEFPSETTYDTTFNHPGVSFFASTGDSAGSVEFPSISPYVTAVGGTTISLDASGNKISESAWSSGGGGVSTINARPAFQTGFSTSANRTTPDVSYDADPNSGVPVYENGSYYGVGGTSAGAPQWAGLAALANQGLKAAGKSPLGTGQAYGTNTVLYQLAGGSSYTNPNGDFFDVTTGNNSHPATTGYDLATGLGSPIANKLIPDLVGPTVTASISISDPGFETVVVGPGGYAYAPTGSPWTFASGAGLTGNNSGFTGGNPNAPQGSQVAFIQGNGAVSQTVTASAAGSFTLSFQAAQRGNFNASAQDFQVLVDGVTVSTFKPAGTSYQTYTTAGFAVTAGAHVIKFLGLDTAGGDNTAFIDNVTVAAGVAVSPTAPSPGDASFESVNVGPGGYAYAPTGSAWTFASGAGLSGNNSGFSGGNPNAPQGSQVAFIQGNGVISQSVAGFTAGSFTLSFQAAQRGNFNASAQDFQVLIDDQVVGTFKPNGAIYQTFSAGFTVTAGAHVIKFLGLDTAGGDNTALIDNITITKP